ncbi:hypothetical protein [Pseudoalteromonas luteoviolacea]|uniref:Uncharacterized protein n=1 Tax=Pseudoalteromonas luteoviolacea H33 TaxID=1365251 RepID=A0A167FUA6_9GAMM|nr:hypothetical protein [Pseudoalteromonas luteoviolacea]KZN52995.1 hypothetical protein N476_09425 [Pseudoalteromonas luteoviolacea H33]KZN78088.1 hypothetical protein N477_10640 [Pseudoalteromonas luteoviolacea H33-S]
MFNIRSLFFVGAVSIIVSGCGGGSDTTPDPRSTEPTPTRPAPTPPSDLEPLELLELIETQSKQYVLDSVRWIEEQQIDCTEQAQAHEMCDVQRVSFSDGQFEQSRTKQTQTILVLDYGMDFHSVLRYRSRVKSTYKYNPQSNSFVIDDPYIHTSKLGVKLLGEVNRFSITDERFTQPQPTFVPAAWLTELSNKYRAVVPQDRYDRETNQAIYSHGVQVFGYLAQHNPQAEFVVIDTSTFTPFLNYKDALCNNDLATFSANMRTAASSLTAEVIEQYGVEFINYSGGFTLESVEQALLQHGCQDALNAEQRNQFYMAIKPVYDALFDAPNTLAFHAGNEFAAQSGDALDLIDYPNRIRVSYYSTKDKDTDLAPYGQSGWEKVFVDHQAYFNGSSSIDLFINLGYSPLVGGAEQVTNSTPKMSPNTIGMSYVVDWNHYSSSWTTPVATSYAIHEQEKIAASSGDDLLDPQRLKSKLLAYDCLSATEHVDHEGLLAFIASSNGLCKIQDPLRHKADELNRMGYLSR